MQPLVVEPVPCLQDNYAYLVHEPADGVTAVVDPSEAAPVSAALDARGWKLDYILNTHHHWDHVGGNLALKEATGARVVGPRVDAARIPAIDVDVGDGEPFPLGRVKLVGLHVPGHTRGAMSYWAPDAAAVFTGDTLFLMGCGRLFEGTPEQMWRSLDKLRKLPPSTRVFCGHEYTESNARFALAVDPGNLALRERAERTRAARAQRLATVPATMAEELATNPFLRADDVLLRRELGLDGREPVEVFAELRRRKDIF